ncbi:MAG: hypothetical protein J6V09_05685 [Clostridia bacterium]|nr:hypothetical protein [Clostridia bacterium]
MKKLISFILVLAILAGAGFYACRRFDIDLSSIFGKEPKFSDIRLAVNDLFVYSGDITIQKNVTSTVLSDGDESVSSYTEVASYDKQSNIGYYLSLEDSRQKKLKIFEENNQYYLLNGDREGSITDWMLYTDENFYEKYGEYVLFADNEMDIKHIFKTHLKGLYLASSLDGLKKSYETVLATATANTRKFAQVADELDFSDGTTQFNVTLDKRDGATVLKTDVTLDVIGFEEGEFGRYKYSTEVAVSDDRVKAITVSITETDHYGDTYTQNIHCTFEYSFDKEGYDDIECIVPLDNAITNSVPVHSIMKVLEAENIVHNDELVNLNDLGALADMLAWILECEYGAAGDVKALYADGDKNTLITNENFDLMDLMEIERIYADVEISSEFAVIRTRGTRQELEQRSWESRIVLGDNWMNIPEQSSTMSEVYNVSANSLYTVYEDEHLERGKDYVIKVNGEVLNSSSFALVGGEEYYVEYIYMISDDVITLDTVYESLIECGY